MVAWGLGYVPSALLIESWPPLLAAGARLGLAGLVLLGVLAASGRSLWPRPSLATVAWLALTQSVLFYGATYWGIQQDGVGLAAVLSNTDPIFVAALGAVLLSEPLIGRQWVGLAMGLIGAGIAAWDGPLWPPGISLSALVVMGGAVAWALGTVTAARGVRATASPLALAAWQMTLGGVALIVWGAIVGGEVVASGPREIVLVVGLAVGASALPAVLFYTALQLAPAAEVSAWFFLIAPIGVLSAWVLLGERPGPALIAGLVAVSVGIWLVVARRPGVSGRLAPAPAPEE